MKKENLQAYYNDAMKNLYKKHIKGVWAWVLVFTVSLVGIYTLWRLTTSFVLV